MASSFGDNISVIAEDKCSGTLFDFPETIEASQSGYKLIESANFLFHKSNLSNVSNDSLRITRYIPERSTQIFTIADKANITDELYFQQRNFFEIFKYIDLFSLPLKRDLPITINLSSFPKRYFFCKHESDKDVHAFDNSNRFDKYAQEPIRISTFSSMRELPDLFAVETASSPPNRSLLLDSPSDIKDRPSIIYSILATIGQYTLVNNKHIKRESSWSRSASTINRNISKHIQCTHCAMRIPLSDLSQIASLKPATQTAEVLIKLSEQHDANCVGRLSSFRLRSEETSKPIEEGKQGPSQSNCNEENILLADGTWLPKLKDFEEIKLLCISGGDVMQTHPHLFRVAANSFESLPKERLPSRLPLDYFPPPYQPPLHINDRLPHSRETALNYFFVQTPPDQSGSNPTPISIADARRRMREVHYDRGAIVNSMDIEAKEMGDSRKRFESFNKSEHLKSKMMAYQLTQLGFFFVGDRNAVGKLRCSFCRRTIHMFTSDDVAYIEIEWERRLIALLHRHSHLSATCPFSLGLNGDDKRFSTDEIIRVIEPLIRIGSILLTTPNLCQTSAPDTNSLYDSLSIKLSTFPDGLIELEGSNSVEYFQLLAEYDYEMFSSFDTEMDWEINTDLLDDLTPSSTPVDYLIGVSAKHRDYWPLQTRIDTFTSETWYAQPIAQANVPLLSPESFAAAGFFYTGTDDNVTCFWCGLGLNHWERTDDPFNEHARFTPRCTWLLRARGRHRVKALYMNAQGGQTAAASLQQVKLADYVFIKDVEEIAGGLDALHISPVDYRTETREAKARVDLPWNRVTLDEFGFSLDLLLHALESQLKETGNDYNSAQQLVETLWAYDEWKNERSIDSDADFVARAEELRRRQPDLNSTLETQMSPRPTSQPTSSSTSEDANCVVCMSSPRSVVLIPCGHLGVCQSCYGRLQQCPICRAVIRGAIRSYMA